VKNICFSRVRGNQKIFCRRERVIERGNPVVIPGSPRR